MAGGAAEKEEQRKRERGGRKGNESLLCTQATPMVLYSSRAATLLKIMQATKLRSFVQCGLFFIFLIIPELDQDTRSSNLSYPLNVGACWVIQPVIRPRGLSTPVIGRITGRIRNRKFFARVYPPVPSVPRGIKFAFLVNFIPIFSSCASKSSVFSFPSFRKGQYSLVRTEEKDDE